MGSATGIHLPVRAVTIESAGQDRLRWIQIDDHAVLPVDEHIVHAEAVIKMYLRFDSAFEIVSDLDAEKIVVSFPEKTSITFGFRSHVDVSSRGVQVPPTVDGLAAALSTLGGAHKTDTPDRLYPSMRAHPPLLDVVDGAEVDEVIADCSNPPIVLRLPRSLESLFVAAPLVYYLGATVLLETRDSPLLETDSSEYHFSNINSFPEEVASLLSRIFYLDCLVRNAGQFGIDIHELDRFEAFPLDTERLYSLPTSERLEEYLDVPFEQIADGFPEWPMAVSIEPTIDNATVIPHLLHRLSLVFPPALKSVDDRTLLARSLGDFYRSAESSRACGRADTDILEPATRRGVVHGWMADGTPVDAFKCLPEAFANRFDYLDQSGPLSVAVILNDEGMNAEFSEVVGTYESRSEAYSIDVDVVHQLSTDELASVFERTLDFVHYIGHCDPEGLRCYDGNISMSSLATCNFQAFFLNA